MNLCLSHKEGVRARKNYNCVWCGEIIETGSLYDIRSGRNYGSMYTMRMHPECHAKETATPWNKREEWYDECGAETPVFKRPEKQKNQNL